MGYQDQVSADIARLREIGALGAAFTLRRLVAENFELRRRVAVAELVLDASDLDVLVSAVETTVTALSVVVKPTETGRRHLRAVP